MGVGMIEILVFAVAVIFDALRDRYYPFLNRFDEDGPFGWSKNQWRWHIFKWVGYYAPLVYVAWKSEFSFMTLFLCAICGFFLWRWIYSH